MFVKVNITKNISFWLVIAIVLSCNRGPSDGFYCAEVTYKHIRTGKNLTQKLLVEVKDNQLTQIVFPEDQADTTTIIPQRIPDNGEIAILNQKGSSCFVKMIGSAEKCRNVSLMVQCKGQKKNGERCQRMTDHPSGTCWQHRKG
jgi:hypothetical protein